MSEHLLVASSSSAFLVSLLSPGTQGGESAPRWAEASAPGQARDRPGSLCHVGQVELSKWSLWWPPESPPLNSPQGCVLRRARWASEAFPTLHTMAAPSLQPTPQGQGLEPPTWPLETGSLETRSLHGGLGQGTHSGRTPGPGSSRV